MAKEESTPFFSAKAPSYSNYGAVGAGASDATAVKDAATPCAGTIADGQFGCVGQRGEAGVRGGGLKPATFRAAGAAPTNHQAARVRGTSIVCLLLLVLIIEAAVWGLGCPAETVECEAR